MKDSLLENSKRVDYYYKVGDIVNINNNAAYKYVTTNNGLFEITQRWTNGTVTFKMGSIKE